MGDEPQASASPDPQAGEPAASAEVSASIEVKGESFKDSQIGETINNYNTITLDAAAMVSLLAGNTDDALGAQASLVRKGLQNLLGLFVQPSQAGARKDGPTASGDQPSASSEIPATDEGLRVWFRQLSAMERCQVRATAILHGAPTHVISMATSELYAASFPRARSEAKADEQDAAPRHVNDTILEHALTTVRFVRGAQRLYWKDVDSDGQSAFGIRALNLVADEISGVAGLRTESALVVTEKWVASGRAEVSVRAAYALGVIWRRLDHQRLRDTVRDWARRPSESLRLCATVMALGAFAAEHAERVKHEERQATTEESHKEKTGDEVANGSSVKPYDTALMLARMGSDAQGPAQRGVDRGLFAVAVSSAYSLIGLDWPEHALDGLDRLLGLSPAFDYEAPHMIPSYVCLPAALAYAELTGAGRVREALARLGTHARWLGRKPGHVSLSQADRERDSRRKDRVFNVTLAFALVIAAASPSSRREWTGYGAHDRLGQSPTFDDNEGRDVLLDGLLSSGETELQFDTHSLLWVSMTGDTFQLAAQILKIWADRIAQVVIAKPDSVAAESFVTFLVALGAFITQRDAICHYEGPSAPLERFRRLLNNWANVVAPDPKKRRVAAIAHDALAAMPTR